MKKTLLFVALAAVMAAPLLSTCPVFAWGVSEGPAEVQLIGTLYSADNKDIKGGDIFRVYIQHMHMVFKVDDARDITGDASSLDIIQAIFPPQLVIEGAKDPIAFLQKPETQGKLITMQGRLYISSGMFVVDKVSLGKK